MTMINDDKIKKYISSVAINDKENTQIEIDKFKERVNSYPVRCFFNPDIEINDFDDLEEIKNAISKMSDVNEALSSSHANLLLLVCAYGTNPEVIKYIVENGGAVNSVDVANFTPIMNMICNETMKIDVKCDLIKYLIEKGANINHLNIQRETALNIAIQMLQIKVANILMDAGAFLYE